MFQETIFIGRFLGLPERLRKARLLGIAKPVIKLFMNGKRPAHVKAPAYLSKSPPVPKPADTPRAPEPDPERPDPVRYGDWELKGVAVDF
jgi:hypothetical protein